MDILLDIYRNITSIISVDILITIGIGFLAGFLASLILNAKNGFIVISLLGIAGGVIGRFILYFIGFSYSGYIYDILVSALGAIIIILISRIIAN